MVARRPGVSRRGKRASRCAESARSRSARGRVQRQWMRSIFPGPPGVCQGVAWVSREGISYLQRRRWPYCSKVQSTLWNPPSWAKDQFKRHVRPRNYRSHPITAAELASRDLYSRVHHLVLRTHEELEKAGLEGWDQGKVNSHDIDDWWFPSAGGFNPKAYRLPDKVLRLRWRLGCMRDGKIIPFSTNAGLGLFDRRGHRLPDYTVINGKVVVIRNSQFIPFLCLFPLASIYLIGGEVNGVEGEIISWRRLWTTEHSRCARQKKQLIALHISPTLLNAVDQLAERQFRTRADLIRQSILKELEAHGICPVAA